MVGGGLEVVDDSKMFQRARTSLPHPFFGVIMCTEYHPLVTVPTFEPQAKKGQAAKQ